MRFCRLILFFLLLALLPNCSAPPAANNLHLAEVKPFSAVVEWDTASPSTERVLYGEGDLYDRVVEEPAPTTNHRVSLTGLKPSTLYRYRLEFSGREGSFRSAPSKGGAFDLIVLDDQANLCRAEAEQPETLPDIVVVTGPCGGKLTAHPENALIVRIPDSGAIAYAYGSWRIVIAADAAQAVQAEAEGDSGQAKTIIVVPQLPTEFGGELAARLIISPRSALIEGRGIDWPETQSAWLEVDAFEVTLVDIASAERKRNVLVSAPAEMKKSCLYCDRLLESGRYEESLNWYRNFIAENQDRYAIEDAYFTIARLLDEKLFAYPKAIEAYREFIERYPRSRQVSLAKHRLKFLEEHSDSGFIPLEKFERAKAELVRQNPSPTVEKVEKLLADAPDAAIIPDSLFWLGHLLAENEPERASRHYQTLLSRFPQNENAPLAAIALGDIQYRELNYREAIELYQNALQVVPENYRISITEKIHKAHRNIWREYLHHLSWFVLAFWLVLTLIRRGWFIRGDWHFVVVTLAVFALVLGVFFGVTYEKTRQLIPVVPILFFATGFVLMWNRILYRRLQPKYKFAAVLHAITVQAATIFLVYYHFHYLYLFGV